MSKTEQDRLLDDIKSEVSIQCGRCNHICIDHEIDDYRFSEILSDNGWRRPRETTYCPQCAKKYLKPAKA